jgi:hypothetical protein
MGMCWLFFSDVELRLECDKQEINITGEERANSKRKLKNTGDLFHLHRLHEPSYMSSIHDDTMHLDTVTRRSMTAERNAPMTFKLLPEGRCLTLGSTVKNGQE